MADTVICAHRGLDDRFPENTLTAFEEALKLGMGVEFDIQMTSDSHLIVLHDDTVDRTTHGSGRAAQMTLEQVKELDAGAWKGAQFAGLRIPTFDEALAVIAGNAKANPAIALDVKSLQPGIIRMICEALNRHSLMDRTVGIGVIRQSVDVRRRFMEGDKGFQCSAVADTQAALPVAAQDPYASWVYGRFVPTPEDVKTVHAAGKRLFVSGDAVSNDVNEAARAFKAGPDVVLTWEPSKLKTLV
jgi:glycerophosphoryl diester phosphodiesterase